MDLNDWLKEQRLIVCVGSGGVGKTTVAATIGLHAARSGRRVMVLTIDPAKRLANSLGLQSFGNEETRIPLDGSGELWAMMLDSRSTFDDLITRLASEPAAAERILDNHIYRHMSDAFAGSQDYMATEKLYDLVTSDRFELVVLDTPPVKNALDFLESPGRLINFMDERVLRWFLAPYNPRQVFGRRLMLGTSVIVFRLLGTIFGKEFLDDLTEFFRDFQGLWSGFRARHSEVMRLFRGEGTAFVTVCAPTPPSVDIATFFQEELRSRRLPRAGVVVNQRHACELDSHDAAAVLEAEVASSSAPETVQRSVLARLGMAHRRLYELARAEESLVRRLRASARGGGFFQQVPRMEKQVHDLEGLGRVARSLFEIPAEEV